MKKTLFAMAALAFCGTAVAGTYSKSTSELTSDELNSFNYPVYGAGNDISLNVNSTPSFGTFNVIKARSVTLIFAGENYLEAGTQLALSWALLTINGDTAALAYWGNMLTSSADANYVPIAITTNTIATPISASSTESASFTGTLKDSEGSELTYAGFQVFSQTSDLETFVNNTLSENEFALVGLKESANVDGYKGLYLVGKGAAATPEPATATLSLLALAALASRRKRK